MKVVVATPFGSYNTVPEQQRRIEYMQAQRPQDSFVHSQLDMHVVHFARTKIVETVLTDEHSKDADVIWWVDGDVLLPDNAHTLLDAVQEYPVVSGLYFARKPPFVPQAYNKLNHFQQGQHPYLPLVNIPDEPFFVDAVGAGCLLVQTRLFKEVEQGFYAERDLAQKFLADIKRDVPGFLCEPEGEAFRTFLELGFSCKPWFEFLGNVGEDFYFCEQLARYCDVRPKVYPNVECAHVGFTQFTREHYQAMKNAGIRYMGRQQ